MLGGVMKKILYLLIFFGLLSIVWADTPWKYGQCIYNNAKSSYVKAEEPIMESKSYTTSGYLFDTSRSERLVCKKLEDAHYKIKYHSNDGTNSTQWSEDLEYGVPYNNLPNITRIGYTFSGWKDGNGQDYSSSITGLCGYQNCIIDLFAQWNPNNYTYNISYVSTSGKSLGSTTASGYYGENKNISAPAKTGYNTPSSQNVVWDSTSPKTITFTYTPITYTISYNLNGGAISGQPTSYTVESGTITLPTPSRSGYTFTGWTESNGSALQTSVTISSGSTGNKSYIANWKAACWKASNGVCYMFANSSGTSIDVSSTSSTGTLTNAYYYSTNNGSTWNKVGGKIFYINTSAGSGKDVFYVAATNNGTGSGSLYYANKNWTTSDGTTSFSGGSAIGDGRSNTNSLLNRSYDSNGPALSWLKSVRNNATNGCSDWYLGSPGEISALSPGISYWHSGSHVYTDLGNWSNCGYNSCGSYSPFSKAVIPMRSF